MLLFALALAAPLWSYQVTALDGGARLAVEATFPAGTAEEMGVAAGAEPFVRGVTVDSRPADSAGGSWRLAGCRRGCRVHYSFALAEAAESLDDSDAAKRFGEVLEATPGTWLLRPAARSQAAHIRLRVDTAPGLRFAAGLRATEGAWQIEEDDLPSAPYCAFGPLRVDAVRIGGATLQIAFPPGRWALGDNAIAAFVAQQGRAVAGYFGRLPVDGTMVLVIPAERGTHGTTMGGGGASVLYYLGRSASADVLERDWVLAHELIHTGLPSLPSRRQHWAEEGFATYLEPIARARAGLLPPSQVWRELIEGLPNGLPGPGDRGLDNTPTWGRTYWGGALFWLLADVRIRERTGNRRSLDDALRALITQGGTIAAHWRLSQVLEVGDRAVGVRVLEDLHEEMGSQPLPVDLDALFRRLGAAVRGGEVVFDDRAPLASIRAAITSSGGQFRR